MHSEQPVETEIVDLAILRAQARSIRQRQPWLSGLCDLIADEADLLESRGVNCAPRLDVAVDIGLIVLEMVFEENTENATPEDTGVLKTLT